MTTVLRTAMVPYSAQQMFELVNDISSYPQFLEWCERTDILEQSEDQIKASLHLNFKGLRKSFTTQNLLQTNKMMEIRLVDGPFKHLEGFWQFEPVGELGCKVSVSLEFEFNQGILDMAFAKVFEYIAGNLVKAFCTRADDLYGKHD